MTRSIFLFNVWSLALLSCGREDPSAIMDRAVQAVEEMQAFSYRAVYAWENPNTGAVAGISGNATFRRTPRDTLVGYHYFLEYSDGGSALYNGRQYIEADGGQKEATIYEVEELDLPQRRLNSLVLLQNSPVKLAAQWTAIRHRKDRVRQLPDTVVAGKALQRIRLLEQDTAGGADPRYFHREIWLDPATHLPQRIQTLRINRGKNGALSRQEIVLDCEGLQPLELPEGHFSLALLPEGFQIREYLPQTAGEAMALQVGDEAPGFTLRTLEGESVSLQDLKGRPVILDFSIINCGFCKLAIRDLNQVRKQYSAEDLAILYLNPMDPAGDLETYRTRFPVDFPMLIDAKATGRAYQVAAYPHLFLLDREGRVRINQLGYSGELIGQLRAEIEKMQPER